MFLEQKNQYCVNESTAQSNVQIQGNPYEMINGIFHRTTTKKFGQYGNTRDLEYQEQS